MRNMYPCPTGYIVKLTRNRIHYYGGTFHSLSEAIATRDELEKTHPLTTDAQRFWSQVDMSGGKNSCWPWQGQLRNGYGEFKRHIYAHRFSYELAHGSIPDGMMIDHICFNRRCVNPHHLRLATNMQNMEHLQGAYRSNKSSGIRGVTWNKVAKLWQIQVCHNYKRIKRYAPTLDEAKHIAIQLRNELMTFNDLDRRSPASQPIQSITIK